MSAPDKDTTSEAAQPPVLKRYSVTLSGTTWTTVDVEAESEEEAAEQALETVKFAYYGWDDDIAFPEIDSIDEVAE